MHFLVFQSNQPRSDALASGYLYHTTGRECWLNAQGEVVQRPDKIERVHPYHINYWYKYAGYPLIPPSNNRTLCEYLFDESLENGMRAYVDFSFRIYYQLYFTRLALAIIPTFGYEGDKNSNDDDDISSLLSYVKDRTYVVCYEDLIKDMDGTKADMDSFLLNKNDWTSSAKLEKKQYTKRSKRDTQPLYNGGHSTSHDPILRRRLKNYIQHVDKKYYNGEIAWLDSIAPC